VVVDSAGCYYSKEVRWPENVERENLLIENYQSGNKRYQLIIILEGYGKIH
jgi:hypothetical protein